MYNITKYNYYNNIKKYTNKSLSFTVKNQIYNLYEFVFFLSKSEYSDI